MEYRDIKKLNQSVLKKILISPLEYLRAKENQEKGEQSIAPHFIFGTVVDIMLTGNKEEFEKKFFKIPDNAGCSDTIKTIVDGVVAEQLALPEGSVVNVRELVLEQCNKVSYYNKWKDDTRIDKILTEGKGYFKLLKNINGRIIITENEYAKAVSCVMALKSDEYTRKYVVAKDVPNVEFWDKFIVEFNYKGFEIKGELDRVRVNHGKKRITPIDFKTTGKSINDFKFEFFAHRYDFQAAVYTFGLSVHPKIKELLDQGYVLEDFLYIVVETNLVNNPMIFRVPEEVLEVGLMGGFLRSGKELEGFNQALDRLQFALDTNSWKYPKEYYSNNGKIDITV